MKFFYRRLSAAVGAAVLCALINSVAFAAGFQVSETTVSGLGRAFAGAGISAEGPADMFHNPAGLMLGNGKQFEIGLHSIAPHAKYVDRGSTIRLLQPPPAAPRTIPLSGARSDGGEVAWVPNFYYAADLSADLRYAVGVTSPFGLTTAYAANWVGRYHAIKSALRTLEVNPAIAWRAKPGFSLGAGLTVLAADIELSRAQFTGVGGADARATVTGDATALGFNFGVVVGEQNGRARFGFGYRSAVALQVDGDLRIPALSVRTSARADVTLPATAYLSGFKKLSEKTDLLATIRWTDWSQFDELRIDFGGGLPSSIDRQNWADANTYSLGFNYRPNRQWTLRGGVARDESPLKSRAFRSARIPDTARDWLTVGGAYQASATLRVDFSFAHLFTDEAPIRQTTDLIAAQPGVATARLNGVYQDTEANIFAMQFYFTLR